MSTTKTQSCSSRITRQLFALAAASVLIGGSALAQTRGAEPIAAAAPSPTLKRDGGQTVTYKQRTNYDFDDDQVEGAVIRPDVDVITGRTKSTHESLVRLRATFQPEMLKSVESL